MYDEVFEQARSEKEKHRGEEVMYTDVRVEAPGTKHSLPVLHGFTDRVFCPHGNERLTGDAEVLFNSGQDQCKTCNGN
jgi:hypothetical protein